MGLTNEHVGLKILAKVKTYVLTRAELLFQVCYEIPCRSSGSLSKNFHGVGIGPLSKKLAVKVIRFQLGVNQLLKSWSKI